VGRPVALTQVGYSFTIDSSKSSVEGGLHVSFSGRIKSVKLLRYIELKSGYADNGPAWIGFVTPSKSGRTLYFNGDALTKFKGQRRGCWGGNYAGYKGEYWVSGVKKNGEDRHWAGSGKVLVETAAVSEYLKTIGAKSLDPSRCKVTHSIVATDIHLLHQEANATAEERVHLLWSRHPSFKHGP